MITARSSHTVYVPGHHTEPLINPDPAHKLPLVITLPDGFSQVLYVNFPEWDDGIDPSQVVCVSDVHVVSWGDIAHGRLSEGTFTFVVDHTVGVSLALSKKKLGFHERVRKSQGLGLYLGPCILNRYTVPAAVNWVCEANLVTESWITEALKVALWGLGESSITQLSKDALLRAIKWVAISAPGIPSGDEDVRYLGAGLPGGFEWCRGDEERAVVAFHICKALFSHLKLGWTALGGGTGVKLETGEDVLEGWRPCVCPPDIGEHVWVAKLSRAYPPINCMASSDPLSLPIGSWEVHEGVPDSDYVVAHGRKYGQSSVCTTKVFGKLVLSRIEARYAFI